MMGDLVDTSIVKIADCSNILSGFFFLQVLCFIVSELNRPPYWAEYSPSRLIIHQVVNSKYFDLAIAGVIGLNVITMAMEYYMMPEVIITL